MILLVTTFGLAARDPTRHVDSPVDAWFRLAEFTQAQGSWFSSISLLMVALIIGYATKPIAMSVTEAITTFIPAIRTPRKQLEDLRFPFAARFEKTETYIAVQKLVEEVTECSSDRLYGTQPFSAAKRYLRLVAPALWEDSERREAEVRLIGTMFLASVYSTILSSVAIVQKLWEQESFATGAAWLILSVCAAVLLAWSFNTARVREVGYTYMNALIARGCQRAAPDKLREHGER
ncbi:MAG TPA: hypothetical protein VFQ45_19575 [Longimicrobium sp.]|nr:hypothetical protein [Longimicrobium sp.]